MVDFSNELYIFNIRSCIIFLKNIELAMDAHGLTWTNTFFMPDQA